MRRGFAILLMLLLSFVVVWLSFQSDEPARDGNDLSSSVPIAPTESSESSSPEIQPRVATAEEVSNRAEIDATHIPAVEVVAARPRLPTEPAPVGKESISGIVVNRVGNPVSGVKVWIERFSGDEALTDEALENAFAEHTQSKTVEAMNELEGEVLRRPHFAESNDSGRFRIGGLPTGRAWLGVFGTDLEVDGVLPRLAATGKSIRIVVARRAAVEVRPQIAGVPVERSIEITARYQGRTLKEMWSPTANTLEFPVGDVELSASDIDTHSATYGFRSDPIAVRVDGIEGEIQQVVLELTERPAIVVRVVPHPTFPESLQSAFNRDGVRVCCLRADSLGDSAGDWDAKIRARWNVLPWVPVRDDVARFPFLEPGRYEIFVTPSVLEPRRVHRSVEFRDQSLEVVFTSAELIDPRAFEVVVRNSHALHRGSSAQGEDATNSDREGSRSALDPSLETLQFALSGNRGDHSASIPINVSKGSQGRYLIEPEFELTREFASQAPSTLTLGLTDGIDSPLFRTFRADSRFIEIDLADRVCHEIEIAVQGFSLESGLHSPFFLTIAPVGFEGEFEPARDAFVRRVRVSLIDTNSIKLAAMRYSIRIECYTGSDGTGDLAYFAEKIVDLDRDLHVDFDLSRLHSLEVMVPGTVEGSVSLSLPGEARLTNPTRHAPIGPDRIARFQHVAPGRYSIAAILDASAETIEITVPEQRYVELRLK